MKKNNGKAAINHRETAKRVDKSELKNYGISRDNTAFKKDDVIEIPSGEDFVVWVDSFIPKGSTEPREYGMIEIYINDVKYDATMKSFRRTRDAVDNEELDNVLDNEIARTLHTLGDDEQRAAFLEGKTLKVKRVVRLTNRFNETTKVNIPIFEELKSE